jgi:WD40 repeat protein
LFLLVTAGANSDLADKKVVTAPLLTLRGHSKTVSTVEFSPDGSRLASVGMDHALLLWDAKSGKRLLKLKSQFWGGPSPPFPSHQTGDSWLAPPRRRP